MCFSFISTILFCFLNSGLSYSANIQWNKKVLIKEFFSSNWGTSPWAWYFYSALPRSLFASLPLVPVGLLLDVQGRRTLIFVLPCLVFVALYSFLPHKELRFVIYVIPGMDSPWRSLCNFVYLNWTLRMEKKFWIEQDFPSITQMWEIQNNHVLGWSN